VMHWYKNNGLAYVAFWIEDKWCNIYNPARIWFRGDHRIQFKSYYINSIGSQRKLNWLNQIKNI
jgi:hypothetical protein